MFDPGKRIECNVCDDCMLFIENGEWIGEGEPPSLPGHWFNDTFDPDDDDPPERECIKCFRFVRRSEAIVRTPDPEFPREVEHDCPHCGGVDTLQLRSSGRDEFSWSSCDCCGSNLGGARHRYAHWPHEE